MKLSKTGQLREKLDKSGINGNPIITDGELKELHQGLDELQRLALDWNDHPLAHEASRDSETVERIIQARKLP